MTSIDWLEVRARIQQLATSPGAARVFGGVVHQFQLEPPLSAAELDEAQQQFGVELPADYRDFLRYAGRGGAGPYYGIFPLRRVHGRWGWCGLDEGDGADYTDLSVLAEPFPVGHPRSAELAAMLARRPEEADFERPGDFDDAYDQWWEPFDQVLWDPRRTVGAVCLCHEGCALRDWLVISGPERGHLWHDDRGSNEDLIPVRQDGYDRATFGAWYLKWLDEATRKAHRPVG